MIENDDMPIEGITEALKILRLEKSKFDDAYKRSPAEALELAHYSRTQVGMQILKRLEQLQVHDSTKESIWKLLNQFHKFCVEHPNALPDDVKFGSECSTLLEKLFDASAELIRLEDGFAAVVINSLKDIQEQVREYRSHKTNAIDYVHRNQKAKEELTETKKDIEKVLEEVNKLIAEAAKEEEIDKRAKEMLEEKLKTLDINVIEQQKNSIKLPEKTMNKPAIQNTAADEDIIDDIVIEDNDSPIGTK